MARDLPQQQRPPHSTSHRKLLPDPIRTSYPHHSKLAGCGPHRSYRHLHHQRGTVGTFHVRLLEGKGLCRRHWSALSLGPVKHLGLSRAHGEVSSFGTCRLAFWRDGNCHDGGDDGGVAEVEREERNSNGSSTVGSSWDAPDATSSVTSSSTPSEPQNGKAQHAAFMPSMSMASNTDQSSSTFDTGKSPLTPFDQGCIRTSGPSRSPFTSFHVADRQQKNINNPQRSMPSSSRLDNEWDSKPSAMPTPPEPIQQKENKMPSTQSASHNNNNFGPPPPHHYAKEQFKSSTVHNDSNPIWGDAHSFMNATHHDNSNGNNGDENRSTFRIPLRKDDLFPTLRSDAAKISLEIRLDEEMAPTESLLVGKALSTAVGAATAATSVVPGVGKRAHDVSNMGMEMLGMGTNRLIGRGYVDLMPLLLGSWEESWEPGGEGADPDGGGEEGAATRAEEEEDDATLDEYGRFDPTKRGMRRRVERMGMMDVWVPLYHPTANNESGDEANNDDAPETSGKVHLLISYEPNGIAPKRDDVVALESFARRPLADLHDGRTASSNVGPIVAPVVPPLSPLLVIESHGGGYLLLEYPVSRTVTSVDRTGNVRSSRWERFHRARVRRTAVFVIERRTLADAVGSVARMPGDVVMSTPLGREVAEASAPIVAGAMELMGPAMLWGKLMMSAGGTGVRVGLAGARAATEAVVTASVEKALERRDGGGGYAEQAGGGDAGVYSSYGG